MYAGKRSFLCTAVLMVINLLLDLVIPMPFTRMPVREYYVMMFLQIFEMPVIENVIGGVSCPGLKSGARETEQPPFNPEHYENLHEKQELLSFCV
jgi:hypothetical protein